MHEKQRPDARLARRFALPQEGIGPAPRITLSGSSHVLVEGQRGLEEYDENCIAVAVARGRVLIRGEKLHLDAMSATELAASGRLWTVELE